MLYQLSYAGTQRGILETGLGWGPSHRPEWGAAEDGEGAEVDEAEVLVEGGVAFGGGLEVGREAGGVGSLGGSAWRACVPIGSRHPPGGSSRQAPLPSADIQAWPDGRTASPTSRAKKRSRRSGRRPAWRSSQPKTGSSAKAAASAWLSVAASAEVAARIAGASIGAGSRSLSGPSTIPE